MSVNVVEVWLKAWARFCPAARTPSREAELVGSVERLEILANRADICVPMSWVEVVKVGCICCNDASWALAPPWAWVSCWICDVTS